MIVDDFRRMRRKSSTIMKHGVRAGADGPIGGAGVAELLNGASVTQLATGLV